MTPTFLVEPTTGFNVAASLKKRRSNAPAAGDPTHWLLQCGRFSEEAEIADGITVELTKTYASMWPLL